MKPILFSLLVLGLAWPTGAHAQCHRERRISRGGYEAVGLTLGILNLVAQPRSVYYPVPVRQYQPSDTDLLLNSGRGYIAYPLVPRYVRGHRH